MSAKKPIGTAWKRIPGGLIQVGIYGPYVWGINKSHHIYMGKFGGMETFEFVCVEITSSLHPFVLNLNSIFSTTRSRST